jgi:hypothetical protein
MPFLKAEGLKIHYIFEKYTDLVQYFFGSMDRTRTEEVPNKYRRSTEQMAKMV